MEVFIFRIIKHPMSEVAIKTPKRKKRARKSHHNKDLADLRKEKKKSNDTIISSWEDLFADKIFATLLINTAHIIDIIGLARTCHRLYRLYFGAGELTLALCHAVKRTYRAEYKNAPLKYLGVALNTEKVVHRKKGELYKANRCVNCYRKLYKYAWKATPCKYLYCTKCQDSIYVLEYHHLIDRIIEICKSKYLPSELPRILRYVRRREIFYGDILHLKINAALSRIYNMEDPLVKDALEKSFEKIAKIAVDNHAKWVVEGVSKLDLKLLPLEIDLKNPNPPE